MTDGDWRPPPPPPSSPPPTPQQPQYPQQAQYPQYPQGPPPAQGRGGCARNAALLIIGAVVGVILLIVVIVAVIGAAVNEADEESRKPASVRIEAAPDVCWLVTLTGTSGGVTQHQQEGCGNATHELGTGLGRNVIVTRRPNFDNPNDSSVLTAVLIVDGKETARQSTNAAGGSVTLSP